MTITAKIIADSLSQSGIRITTMELEYPRFVHAELMTHRMFSRNAASSRAIPIKKVRHMVKNAPARPYHWGANQSGMQAKAQVRGRKLKMAKLAWAIAAKLARVSHWLLEKSGVHKQITNRVVEPFQTIKVVVTATEWQNFLWLRDHQDAQPEIAVLAKQVASELRRSTPKRLKQDEWHLPYLTAADKVKYPKIEDQLAISVSCCAQVSYRTLDKEIGKAHRIMNSLTSGSRIHASPFEHQAQPMGIKKKYPHMDKLGITHRDSKGNNWSGNFRGWIQHRQLIKGHVKNG